MYVYIYMLGSTKMLDRCCVKKLVGEDFVHSGGETHSSLTFAHKHPQIDQFEANWDFLINCW